MNEQNISETWKQLNGLDANQAEAAGWCADSIEWSPTLGHRMDLWNPRGVLVAWGWTAERLDTAAMIRASQKAYAEVSAQ